MTEYLVMGAFFALCLFLLWREGLLHSLQSRVWACTELLTAFFLRTLALPYETLDYQNFLTRWVDFFRMGGGFRALSESVGNYNVPYLYFLAAFSYTDYSDLYLIKYLSIAFDILLAWAVMKLVSLVNKRAEAPLWAFVGTLLLPTVVLNGSLWGQCDSIYVALALMAIWCMLTDRPRLSLMFMALSFSFKLQAVFFMPLFFVFFESGRIRWRDIWVFPATYLLAVLPAVLMGRSLLSTLTLYLDQAGTVGSGLNYNSPSVYSFYTGGGDEEKLAKLGILAAFVFCLALLAFLCLGNHGRNNKVMLCAFTLTAICVPLLLPHMHDRYFFGADVLSFVLLFLGWEMAPLPFLCSFASLLGYHAYLKMRYLLPMRTGAVALIFAALLILVELYFQIFEKKSKNSKNKA